MARIRSKDTKPEMALRQALYAAGIRGWRCHPKAVPGKPDIAFTRRRVAVFVDGRFWHGHPDFFTPGKSGDYWDAKIARTQERDRQGDAAVSLVVADRRVTLEGTGSGVRLTVDP